jgi:phenylacetate-coenzyme A ligase PaaK-like adenylate-forming protein
VFTARNVADIGPFSLAYADKCALFVSALSELTRRHYEKCPEYRRLLDAMGFDLRAVKAIEDFPFVPARLFKEFDLLSVDRSQVFKTLTSSGTGGQRVSKILLDRETAANQSRALAKIVTSFIGKQRRPMLVIDSSTLVKDRRLFSARGAGILGFSTFGTDVTCALNDSMQLDLERVNLFLAKHKGKSILLFGFTSIIWEHFCAPLAAAGRKLAIGDGTVIHGGGWKKLAAQGVDKETFRARVSNVCGVSKVHDYYGMVEQTGSIFMECEAGCFHSSSFSEIVVRDHRDFSPLSAGSTGILQLLSVLPSSYPGHSILSEDVGELVEGDECSCGRKGRRFVVHGRLPAAEVRGCSDTYGSTA